MSITSPPRSQIAVPEPDLTPHAIVERAQGLRQLLVDEQEATEQRTYYSSAIHEQFLAAGFYRILQPRRFGGYEFDVPTFYRVVIEISRGCPSTGWCMCLCSSHVLQVASFFSEDAQAEIFGPDGDFRAASRDTPGGTATEAEAGWIVNGKWDYCSGAPYSTHFVGVANAVRRTRTDAPAEVVFAVPRAKWRLADDWRGVLGLRGSGSHSVAVEDAHLAPHLVLDGNVSDRDVSAGTIGSRLHDNPMYAGRTLGFFHGELASVMVGTAKAALDEYEQIVKTRKTYFPPQVPRYLHHDYQEPFGLAMGKIASAEAIVLHVGKLFMEYTRRGVEEGVPFSLEEDYLLDAMDQQAGRLAWEAIELLFHTAGSSAARDGHRMQRYMRDVLMYRSHMASLTEVMANRMAALHLGVDPGETQLLKSGDGA